MDAITGIQLLDELEMIFGKDQMIKLSRAIMENKAPCLLRAGELLDSQAEGSLTLQILDKYR